MITYNDIRVWTEALASCAIEGNKFAIEMLELKKTDPIKFISELIRLNATAYKKEIEE